jgi:6-pyruvoyltetrahydropterin/6-carboxytetrahydropterin synthase
MSGGMLIVKHNIEVAHRLSLTPGKCENIHGHSMWVELALYGTTINESGMLEGMDFGGVKKAFRAYLDEKFDHRLLLNIEDPWADNLDLPGLFATPGDPTTENISRWIYGWAVEEFNTPYGSLRVASVKVDETATNSFRYTGD